MNLSFTNVMLYITLNFTNLLFKKKSYFLFINGCVCLSRSLSFIRLLDRKGNKGVTTCHFPNRVLRKMYVKKVEVQYLKKNRKEKLKNILNYKRWYFLYIDG